MVPLAFLSLSRSVRVKSTTTFSCSVGGLRLRVVVVVEQMNEGEEEFGRGWAAQKIRIILFGETLKCK